MLFALFHLNPGIGWYTGIHFWLAGMVFALPVLLRGELAMAIGIHVMFNYTMIYVLGLGDVGLRASGSILVVERGETGIWFGTAGMIEPIVLLVAVIPILGWIQWRDQIPLRKQLKQHTQGATDSTE